MFRATFLGHHGWLYATAQARILVDPLFHDRFGLTDAVELRVYPPRHLDVGALPPLEAVMLTHEHEGHFDLASLQLLDRRVPIYIPARSSEAMRAILGEMGFQVHLLDPGIPVTKADLEFLPITADQVRDAIIEEWDSLAYLVRDTGGDGSLFTSVDMPPNEAMWRLVRERVGAPGLWAYTNNHSAFQLKFAWCRPDLQQIRRTAAALRRWHEALCASWQSPAASLIVGGGFAFGGERSWLNRNVFTVDSTDLARILQAEAPAGRWIAPAPGRTFVMREGALVADEDAAFVRALPQDQWPSKRYVGDRAWLDAYPPACRRRALAAGELAELERELAGLAAHLYGRGLFRGLYSLTAADTPGRKPAIAFVLLADDDGGAYVFEYAPQACRFVPAASTDPVSDYLAVFECWATDLLAFLRCEISSTTLEFAYSRAWNANPAAFRFDIEPVLFEYVHPLRMPERWLATYRKTVAAPSPTPPLASSGQHAV